MNQGLLSAVGVLLLTLLAIMVLHEWDMPSRGLTDSQRQSPLVMAEQVSARTWSEAGTLQYDVHAETLTELDALGRTHLTRPRFRLHDPALVWEITAEQADVTERGHHVRLAGSVRARQQGGQQTLLETEELVYQPDLELITAPGPVRLVGTQGSSQADSLRADISQERLEMKGRVRTTYEMPAE